MATARTNAGDPARTLALLWRHAVPAPAGSRGPRPGLSVDAVVGAAVALADRSGLEAVTIRAVAQALGAAPMTLYTYVPGRNELVDLMLDAAYAAMSRTTLSDTGWRPRVQAVAEDNRALVERHPWLAAVDTTRPALGPGAIAKYDHELGAFDGCGLDDVTTDAALAWTLAFVRDWARTALAARRAREDSALDDAQWWAVAGPLLGRALDPSAYPRAVRVGEAAGQAYGAAWDPGHAFAFGLARVLDGLAGLIESTP